VGNDEYGTVTLVALARDHALPKGETQRQMADARRKAVHQLIPLCSKMAFLRQMNSDN
jgi:hypothetical protein